MSEVSEIPSAIKSVFVSDNLSIKELPTKFSSGALLIYKNAFLLYLRDEFVRENPKIPLSDGGKLSIFGGKGEVGETIGSTLERELKEEIDVIPENIHYLGILPPITTHVRHISAAVLTDYQFMQIHMGEEGQFWGLYDLDWLLANKDRLATDIPAIFNEGNREALQKLAEGKYDEVTPEDLGLTPAPFN